MSSPRKVGLFVAFTLAVIAGMILNFSKSRGVFTPSLTFDIVAERVGGLKVGAPVALSGVPIGSVSGIDLTDDRRSVKITVRVVKKYPIHADAKFGIEQSGFLGDEFVSIVPQKNEKPPLENGATVRAETPFNLQDAARSATALLGKLDTAVERINSAVERVDQKLLTEATLTNLSETAVNFRLASAEATEALHDVRRLVTNNSPTITATFSNLNTLSVQLATVATNVDGFLAEQKPAIGEVLGNASAATADLKSMTADLRAGRGVAGALLADEALRLQLGGALTNMATVSSNLARFGILYKPPQPRKVLTNQVKYTGRDPWK